MEKVLQSETDVVKKWDRCYKVGQMLLQSDTGVTKWDRCYKVGSSKHLYTDFIMHLKFNCIEDTLIQHKNRRIAVCEFLRSCRIC